MKRFRGTGLVVGGAVLVMVAGGFFVLRPFLFRETLVIAVASEGRIGARYTEGVIWGLGLALDERGGRAGRFRVRLDFFREFDPRYLECRGADVILDTDLSPWILNPTADEVAPVLSVNEPPPGPEDGRGLPNPIGRVIPGPECLGGAAADWAAKLGARRVLLLELMFDPRGSAIAETFRKRAAALGLDLADHLRFHEPYDGLADEILGSGPEAIFMAGEVMPLSKSPEVLARLRDRGFQGEFLFADARPTSSLLLGSTPFTEGCRLVSLIAPPSPEFSARYGATPPGAWQGYQAAKAALDAIEKAGSKDPRTVRRALASHPAFDANGDPASPVLSGYTLKDGAWQFTESLK